MRRFITVVGLLAVAVILTACSGASGANPSPASADPNALHISARDLRFSTDKLTTAADKPFQIVFENQEGAPHNVAIYSDSSASKKVFGQDPFSNGSATYSVPALAAGSYFFRCDVHQNMKGTLEVE